MAALQKRGQVWRALFRYPRQQHAVTISKVSETEAVQWKGKIELTLMRLAQPP